MKSLNKIYFSIIIFLKLSFILILYASFLFFLYIPRLLISWKTDDIEFVRRLAGIYVKVIRFIGIKYETRGLEYLQIKQSCLVIGPHQSVLDIILLADQMRNLENAFIPVKKEVEKIPIFRYFSKKFKYILYIDRKDRAKTMQLYRDVMEQHKNEKVYFTVFIEGTRNPTRKLLPFKRAPFEIAVEGKFAILPVAVSQYQWYRSEKPKSEIDTIVQIMPPISTANYTKDNVGELIDHCQCVLQNECDKLNAEIDARDKIY